MTEQSFRKNEYVVYPKHGVGQIRDLQEINIDNQSLKVIVIACEREMTLRVPVEKATSLGLRKISNDKTIKSALSKLKEIPKENNNIWARRSRDYEERVNSGDLIILAEMIRDLNPNQMKREISYSERLFYDKARERVIREISVAKGISNEKATELVDEHLKK